MTAALVSTGGAAGHRQEFQRAGRVDAETGIVSFDETIAKEVLHQGQLLSEARPSADIAALRERVTEQKQSPFPTK
jgi:hypothetical protein